MDLIYYPIFIIALTIALRLILRKRSSNALELENAISISQTLCAWAVLVKLKGIVSLDFESDDLGKVGYHIFSKYRNQLMNGQILIFIKDTQQDRFLKIIADNSSESMISVDHPNEGHIGYLSFEEVTENAIAS